MAKDTIKTWHKASGFKGGKQGCYIAELGSNRKIWEASTSRDGAVKELLYTLKVCHHKSGERADYNISDE